jgi:hypothetical protein
MPTSAAKILFQCLCYAGMPFDRTLFLNDLCESLCHLRFQRSIKTMLRRYYGSIKAPLQLRILLFTYFSTLFHTPECERCQNKSNRGKNSNKASVTEDNTTSHYFLKVNVIELNTTSQGKHCLSGKMGVLGA